MWRKMYLPLLFSLLCLLSGEWGRRLYLWENVMGPEEVAGRRRRGPSRCPAEKGTPLLGRSSGPGACVFHPLSHSPSVSVPTVANAEILSMAFVMNPAHGIIPEHPGADNSKWTDGPHWSKQRGPGSQECW